MERLSFYQVGKKYSPYAIGEEGFACDYNKFGLHFYIFICNPTLRERRSLNETLEFGVTKIDSMDWFTFFYNGLEFDTHFAPGFFKFNDPTIKMFEDWNGGQDEKLTCNILAFNACNGELLSARQITFDHKISEQIVEFARAAAPMSPEAYNYEINNVYNKYTTKDLRHLAIQQRMTKTFKR